MKIYYNGIIISRIHTSLHWGRSLNNGRIYIIGFFNKRFYHFRLGFGRNI